MSLLRYVQRTGEPLVMGDATGDDRFAPDPYFTGADCCSLLALPILSRGMLRAVLVLENRLICSAFTAERLDAVKLIAGQLGVSLDNAQLYAELSTSRARIVAAADQSRWRIERDLHDGAQQQLVSLGLRMGAARAAVPPELGDLAAELDSVAAPPSRTAPASSGSRTAWRRSVASSSCAASPGRAPPCQSRCPSTTGSETRPPRRCSATAECERS